VQKTTTKKKNNIKQKECKMYPKDYKVEKDYKKHKLQKKKNAKLK
jgi:hypothetical protein